MGNLTFNELSNSLNDYMDEKQNMEDHSLMTENKTIVSAINEIYGKKLIADAIGEPLNENDTFSAMSNDINGLLSTFKNNMMNNGITVEAGDKFKQLIDKIATMVEESEGKGIRFASGTCGVSTGQYIKVTDLGFTPSTIIVSRVFKNPLTNTVGHFSLYCPLVTGNPNSYIVGQTTSDSLGATEPMNLDGSNMSKSYISGDSFQIGVLNSSTSYQYNWIAIGIGEEDTTLRDSLASILESNGVDVSDEDDMASLIGKVDEELDRINAETSIMKTGTATVSNTYNTGTFTVNINPGFVPKEIICTIKSFQFNYTSGSYTTITTPTVVYSKYNNTSSNYVTLSPRNNNYGADVYISSISQSNFVVTITRFTGYSIPSMSIEWIAIS